MSHKYICSRYAWGVPSPKLVPLVLSDAERASLEALARKRMASKSLAERARIVLACAEDGGVKPLTRVAGLTGVSRETVRKWRMRFMEGRESALADAPRAGAPRRITGEQKEVLVMRTRTEKGPGRDSRWSTRTMAAEAGMSQSSVSRIWRCFGLKPHPDEARKPKEATEDHRKCHYFTCDNPLPQRRDAKFCSAKCRQRTWRLGVGSPQKGHHKEGV